MRISLLLLVLVYSISPLNASAEIYRWVDAGGNVVYGDTPPKTSSAKKVALPILTVADSFTPPPPTAVGQPEQKPEDSPNNYTRFKVSSPEANGSVFANDGNLTVTLDIEPALTGGDSIKLYLDSKQVADGVGTSFPLSNIERGSHTVFAVVSNSAGDIVQNTETVMFQVQRASILSPARSPKANP